MAAQPASSRVSPRADIVKSTPSRASANAEA
jgi:hypothetical protein